MWSDGAPRTVPTLVTPQGILVRLDSTPEIGAGHAVRCHALALALRFRRVPVAFATQAPLRVHLAAIERDGFPVTPLPTADVRALGPADLEATAALAVAQGAGCVLVDHYGADAAYLRGLARSGFDVAVVDDLADRDLSDACWILNQNLGAERIAYPGPAALGLRYAMLRPQFAADRARTARTFAAENRNLLVTYGGGDTSELVARVLDGLEQSAPGLDVRIILATTGRPTVHVDVLGGARHQVGLLGKVADMGTQMAWADVSLNAGGSTCWELACLGTPMVATALSPDQEPNVRALVSAGAAVAVGAAELENAPAVAGALLADPVRRAAMSRVASSLVDGRGAARAAASLLTTLAEKAERAA
jgi:UDP-2,4-diacetamido-2,4,6-trideoxy-beta-L-altropyranose hydrolase